MESFLEVGVESCLNLNGIAGRSEFLTPPLAQTSLAEATGPARIYLSLAC